MQARAGRSAAVAIPFLARIGKAMSWTPIAARPRMNRRIGLAGQGRDPGLCALDQRRDRHRSRHGSRVSQPGHCLGPPVPLKRS